MTRDLRVWILKNPGGGIGAVYEEDEVAAATEAARVAKGTLEPWIVHMAPRCETCGQRLSLEPRSLDFTTGGSAASKGVS